MTTQARRVRIEYDFTVTSKSLSIVDRIDTKTKNLNSNVTKTTHSINRMSQSMNAMHAPARRASSALDAFSRSTSKLSRNIGYAFRNLFSWRTLFLGFATGNVLGSAKRALIDYNVEMDNFRQGISMSLNQMTDWKKSFGGVSNAQERWNKSMIGSQAIMNNLRKYAAQSIGSVKEYAEAFQLINSQIMAIGGTAGDSIDVSKRLVPLTKASGRDIMTGAMDINQILRGDPNLRQINLPALRDPRVLELSKLARGNPKKGIAGDPKLALEKLLEILKESDTGVKAYGKTYQAQLETMTDNLQVFAAEVGKPIFERITKEMSIFNKEWAVTQAGLKRTGEKFGKFLVEAFDKGKEGLNSFIGGLKQVAASVLTLTQAMIGLRLAGMASGLAGMLSSGASRNALALPSFAGLKRLLNIGPIGPLPSNALSGPAAGAGIIPGASNAAGAAGAAAAGTGARAATVGAMRGGIGTVVAGMLGLGIALTITTERAKTLAKEEGYLGKMARETGEVVKGFGVVITAVADAAIGLVGAIGSVGRAIGEMSAHMYGFRPPTGTPSFGTGQLGEISKSVESITSLGSSQQAQIASARDRLQRAYGGGPLYDFIINNAMKGVNMPTGPTQAEQYIASGNYDAAFRSISAAIISESQPTGTAARSMVSGSLFAKGSAFDTKTGKTDKSILTKIAGKGTIQDVPLNDKMIAAAIAGGQLTPEQADRATKEMTEYMLKYQVSLDNWEAKLERQLADEYKGRGKNIENKFDFSGSQITMNNDFRNEDPDRVYVKFAEDIGLISSNHVQSRLSPVVY